MPSSIDQWIEAFNSHNVAALTALYTSGAELFDSGMPRPRRGHEEIARWFIWRFRSTPTITYAVAGHYVTGDGTVTVRWTARGHGPRFFGQSWLSRPFQVDGESIFTLRDGLIHQQRGAYDHLSVLKQIVPPFKWLPAWVAASIYTVYLRRSGLSW